MNNMSELPGAVLAHWGRLAADILEEFSRRYDAIDPTFYEWNAQRLRLEADHVEAEDD